MRSSAFAGLAVSGALVAAPGTHAAASSRVTLDLGGPIKIKVEEGVIDGLIEQGGAIRADGGLLYLTAKTVGEVTRTVLNHTGIIEARTLSNGKDGKIHLMRGMKKDRIAVAGKLDASAPNGGNGGNGGFVETSAAIVKIADDVRVTTAAPKGKTGTWLIDPVDFSINAGSGARTTHSIGASTLVNTLNQRPITITADAKAWPIFPSSGYVNLAAFIWLWHFGDVLAYTSCFPNSWTAVVKPYPGRRWPPCSRPASSAGKPRSLAWPKNGMRGPLWKI
jgi:hypothetical protein